MPIYEYTAINTQGRNVKGTLDAENPRAARQRLRTQEIYPTNLREVADQSVARTSNVQRYFQRTKVSRKELSVGTRQLATLIGAGLPLVAALQALTDQTESPIFKRILVETREMVEQGSSLAAALGKFPQSFPRLYVNMVASSEASGTLDTVMDNLADYLEAQVELRRKVTSAFMYPILMLGICSLVVTGLLVFVVPRIVEIFQRQGAVLPLPTRILIALSNFLIYYWYIPLFLVTGGTYAVIKFYRQPKGREFFDRVILRLPLYRTLYIKIATARIARTLGALLASGVGLLNGLDIVRNIINNVHIARAIDEARDGVREGKSLARELGKSGIFPSMLSHMIAVGEKSGELETMLKKVGKAYESEVSATLSGLTSLLEPLLMIVVGAIVLFIVISVLLPMADLIQVMQK